MSSHCHQLLSVATACAIALSFASRANCDEPTITVTGEAMVLTKPDQVVITASVDSRAPTVAAATNDNDTKVRGIVEYLKKSGVEDKHLQTEYISIDPIMRNTRGNGGKSNPQQANIQAVQGDDPFGDPNQEAERPVGYLASRQFAITIVELKNFESIYKGLIEQGINRVQGIDYRTSELRNLRDRARLDAVRAARQKAKAISGELGATLAAVKTIRETTARCGTPMSQNRVDDLFGESSVETTSLATGGIAITASVEIVFVLGDTTLKSRTD